MKHQLSPNEIRAVISAIDEQNNLWRAFVSLADFQVADMTAPTCDPGLSDAERHYRAGCLYGAILFRKLLDETMAEAKKLR